MATDKLDQLFGVDEIKSQQQQVIKIIDDTIKHITDASGKFRLSDLFVDTGGKITQSTDALKKASTAMDALTKSTQGLNDAELRASQIRANEAQALKDNAVAYTTISKELERVQKLKDKEEAQAKKNTSAYEALKKTYNDTAKAVLDLGVRVGVTDQAFVKAAGDLKKMHDQLYEVESAIGRNQRNVGNYAASYNGLSMSLGNIASELPNLSQSVQTFARAVSNNIVPVGNDIARIVEQNKILISQGQPVVSVWKQIGASIIGWQTALSIGTAVAVDFFPKFIDWLRDAEGAAKALAVANLDVADTLKFISDLAKNNEFVQSLNEQLEVSNAKKRGASDIELTEIHKKQVAERIEWNKKEVGNLETVVEHDKWWLGYVSTNKKYRADDVNNAKSALDRSSKLLETANDQKTKLSVEYEVAKNDIIIQGNKDEKAALDKSKQEYDRWAKANAAALERLRESLAKYRHDLQNPTDSAEQDEPAKVKKRNEALKDAYDKASKYSTDHRTGIIEDTDATTEAQDDSMRFLLERTVQTNKNIREENKKTAAEKKKQQDEELKQTEETVKYALQVANILGNIYKSTSARRIKDLDDESERVRTAKEDEVKLIEHSQLSEEKKLTAIADAQAIAANKELDIQDKKHKEQQRAAAFEKTLAVTTIFLELFKGLSKEIGSKGLVGLGTGTAITAYITALVGAVGAIAIPQYAEGTENHPGGKFIAGDGGAPEWIQPRNKKGYWSASSSTLYNEGAGTRVIPLQKLDMLDSYMVNNIPMPLPINPIGMTDAQVDRMVNAMSKEQVNISYNMEDGEWKRTITRGSVTTTYKNSNNK